MAVIVIVGLARSGKDTAADYIAKKYGYAKYTFSTVLNEMLESKGIKSTKERMKELGDLLREEMGMDAVAKMLDKKITQKKDILLVGPRSIEEIEYFQKKFPDLHIIKVVSGKQDRFKRKNHEDPQNEKEFYERDNADFIGKGLQKVLDSAEIQLNNFSTLEQLHYEIDTTMQLLLTE
jgi:dephospho-CoA kinase